MKKSIILFFALVLTSFEGMCQVEAYGGSAYVKVQNKNNNETRWITVVTGAFDGCRTESCAQSKLNSAIESEKKYDEEMITRPTYDVEENESVQGGSASVRVRNKSGSTRVIVVELSQFDQAKSIFAAKRRLLGMLDTKKSYDEVFADPVEFDLE